jgi:hypothetical protein
MTKAEVNVDAEQATILAMGLHLMETWGRDAYFAWYGRECHPVVGQHGFIPAIPKSPPGPAPAHRSPDIGGVSRKAVRTLRGHPPRDYDADNRRTLTARKWQRGNDRKAGEFVNPHTGEIVAGCLTIGRLASELGMSTRRLSDTLRRHRLIFMGTVRADTGVGPVETNGAATMATRWALEEGLMISIPWKSVGRVRELILITPDGQRYVRGTVADISQRRMAA